MTAVDLAELRAEAARLRQARDRILSFAMSFRRQAEDREREAADLGFLIDQIERGIVVAGRGRS